MPSYIKQDQVYSLIMIIAYFIRTNAGAMDTDYMRPRYDATDCGYYCFMYCFIYLGLQKNLWVNN